MSTGYGMVSRTNVASAGSVFNDTRKVWYGIRYSMVYGMVCSVYVIWQGELLMSFNTKIKSDQDRQQHLNELTNSIFTVLYFVSHSPVPSGHSNLVGVE